MLWIDRKNDVLMERLQERKHEKASGGGWFADPSKYLLMSEPPFRPREKLIEKQKFYQSVHKHTYLKGPFDKITSVAIPIALAATSLYMIGRGIYNMSHGIGKKE
ncbi:hypothetical protein RIF29_27544 [Crotalaria pallida]|uniref:Uncharacterized protein n=1 Tax=Crotalaria pallida TaxID=3830 RepID=A0AAN9EP97_CROPI